MAKKKKKSSQEQTLPELTLEDVARAEAAIAALGTDISYSQAKVHLAKSLSVG